MLINNIQRVSIFEFALFFKTNGICPAVLRLYPFISSTEIIVCKLCISTEAMIRKSPLCCCGSQLIKLIIGPHRVQHVND